MEKLKQEVESILWNLVAKTATEMFAGKGEYDKLVQDAVQKVYESATRVQQYACSSCGVTGSTTEINKKEFHKPECFWRGTP